MSVRNTRTSKPSAVRKAHPRLANGRHEWLNARERKELLESIIAMTVK